MQENSSPPFSRKKWYSLGLPDIFQKIIWTSFFIVTGLAILDLAGWIFDISILKSIMSDWEVMSVITSVCLIFTTISLIFIRLNIPYVLRKIIPGILVSVLILVSLFTLYDYLKIAQTGQEPALPISLYMKLIVAQEYRIGLRDAFKFLITGTAILLLLSDKKRTSGLAHVLIIPVLILTYYNIISRILDVNTVTLIQNMPVALNTAIAFLGICIIVLSMKPETWLLKAYTSPKIGGIIARKLLPPLMILPVVIGWIRIKGEQAGLFESEQGVVFVAMAYTISFLILIWVTARSVNNIDRKLHESDEALHLSEQHLKYHFENSPLAVVEWDSDFIVINWSVEAVRIFGFEKEDVLGKNINSLNLICEEDIPIVERTIERLLTGKELKVVSENRNYTKNKDIINCVWYNSVLTDENGKMLSIMSLVEDVSEIRRKENLLREGEAKLRSVLNATQESIYMFDREGRFTISNSTGVKRLGKHSEDEIIGHHFRDFIPAKIVADRQGKIEEVFQTGKPLEFEDLRGNMVFHHYFSPVLRDNQVINVVTYSTDITEQKRAENEIRESEAKLKDLNATKDKFFNIVAHDLKNPFTSLMGSSELLYENIHSMSPDNIKKLASILNDSAKGGYSILQNLLDWSRSQTGLLKITPQKINLKNLVEENISNLQLPAANKQISLNIESKEDIYVISDKNMINTILRNLLSNAIKFTRKGGNVSVKILTDADKFVIQVNDNGIGIPADKIEKLFNLETKHTEPGTEKEQGTGLGLKLCKEFVEKLGGTIKVVSIENEGSKFSFSIPLKN